MIIRSSIDGTQRDIKLDKEVSNLKNIIKENTFIKIFEER
jgi:hypothetical protein